MPLRLARGFSLPEDAVTQTFGILAVRGSGKTNTAVVMAEEMYAARQPFVVIDPVGVWWGLRATAQGSKGLEIPVFGGRHADVPLERGAGQLIADLVVDERLTCVLDVSEFSETDKIHFLRTFAERLYRRNTEPLHLFLEEADDYAPQRPMREQAHLLRAWENIVRRGRSRGLGITMITQRSAALNKNVLTQIETLIVLRTTSPNDRKAIAGWVDYHGLGKDMVESLPALETGEAWIWSPSWLGTFERVKIRKRKTYDSSVTPTSGGRKAANLADVDLGAIEAQMKEAIERAKETDPKELRARIKELKREVNVLQTDRDFPTEPEVRVEIREVTVPLLTDEQMQELRVMLQEMHRNSMNIEGAVGRAEMFLAEARRASLESIEAAAQPAREKILPTTPTAPSSEANMFGPLKRATATPQADGITRPQQSILNALARFEAARIENPKRTMVAAVSGYSSKSSGFEKNISTLRTNGYIDYPQQGFLQLTDAGREVAETPDTPMTQEELHQAFYRMVGTTKGGLLSIIISAYPKPLTREELADRSGYSVKSSGFEKNVSQLSSWGLIEYPVRGQVRAAEFLFTL